MSYSVSMARRARKGLADLPDPAYEKVKEAIKGFIENPRPVGCKKLVNRPGWRIRIGDFRVVYEIDDEKKTVEILDIGHRRSIYH